MYKKIKILIVIFFLFISGFIVYNKSQEKDNHSGLQVTTSFYPMYFFTSQIGKDKVSIINITPDKSEPHDYDLTPQDIIHIEESKLLVVNGVVEPWIEKIKNNLKNKNTKLVIAGDGLTVQNLKENGNLEIDPHIWLSPRLAKIESQKITDALINIDKENSTYYKSNLNILETNLDKLDKDYKKGLSSCITRTFVTSHSAFGYLAKDYNLTQISISGLTPEEEPSLSKLAEISNLAKSKNIKYIFFESLVSPKLTETIANEIGAKTLVLDPIESLLNNKGSYLTLMEDNLQNLRIALQCK